MDEPFDSLARGLNKDLSALLDTEGIDVSKRPTRFATFFGVANVPTGIAQGHEEFFAQRPFESLSDRFAHEIAVFPLANHVVINRFGAFIPQSIFGSDADLAFKEERNQSGTINITVHSKNPMVTVTMRARLGNVKTLRRDDPIFDIGKDPVACGVPDASEDLDKYLYGVE